MPFDPENTQTSRRRLLEAGRTLFGLHGFEQTSTATIAREAGTSESQLVRNFVTKAGLLEVILNESWQTLRQQMHTAIAGAATSREAMDAMIEAVLESFRSDPEAEVLFLFEVQRLQPSFTEFQQLLQIVIDRGRRDGTFDARFQADALACALIGAAGAMMRQRSTARRANSPEPFTEDDLRGVFRGLVGGLVRNQDRI